MLRCLALGGCFSKYNFAVTKTQSCAFIHVAYPLLGNNSKWAFSHFNRTPNLWPLSVYEGICLSSFTGCKHRLHPPINDHYQSNDSSGWPGKIRMGITSRQIRYFYLCIETYKFMECWFWIVQRIDCSWNSASCGFHNSTAIFGASFKSLIYPVVNQQAYSLSILVKLRLLCVGADCWFAVISNSSICMGVTWDVKFSFEGTAV